MRDRRADCHFSGLAKSLINECLFRKDPKQSHSRNRLDFPLKDFTRDLFIVLCLLFSSRSPKIKLFPTKSGFGFLSLGQASGCFVLLQLHTQNVCVFYVLTAMPLNPISISAYQEHFRSYIGLNSCSGSPSKIISFYSTACCLGGVDFWESWIMFSQDFHSQPPCTPDHGKFKQSVQHTFILQTQ